MQYKEKGYISLVCYLSNDADVIEPFVQEIMPLIRETFENYQLVFVDDFSSDKTFETTVKALEEINVPGSVLRLSQKHGSERGILAGLDKAVGDFIIEFSCPVIDFPLNLISQSFEAIKSGKDIAVIHPENPSNFTTKFYYFLFNKLSYLNEPLATERVLVMTRRALNSILSIDERIRYKKALLSLAGFPKKNIPYKPTNNNYIDKRSFSEKILSAFENFASYTSIGSRAPIFLSAIFLMVSMVIGVWVTYNYFFLENVAGVGWVSIMGFMSISFSGLFFLLGILSEYVTKILREIVNIPIYTIGQTYTSSSSNEEDQTPSP
jgi:polyisoprenyl-phosphate glycosyltransferase